MDLQQFLKLLKTEPQSIQFEQAMDVIDANFDFCPIGFSNGDVVNEAGQNNGSCKIFSFAQLQALSEEETLACFGSFYRDDVLANPAGTDHGNIRNFIEHGWKGISFEGSALKLK